MQKRKIFHSHDAQLPGEAHVREKRVTLLLLLWIQGGGVGVKQIRNSLHFFTILSHPNLSLLFHNVSLFFHISTFYYIFPHCLLLICSSIPTKKIDLTFNFGASYQSLNFHKIHMHKPYWKIFQRNMHRARQGMKWAEVKAGEKISPVICNAQIPSWGKS